MGAATLATAAFGLAAFGAAGFGAAALGATLGAAFGAGTFAVFAFAATGLAAAAGAGFVAAAFAGAFTLAFAVFLAGDLGAAGAFATGAAAADEATSFDCTSVFFTPLRASNHQHKMAIMATAPIIISRLLDIIFLPEKPSISLMGYEIFAGRESVNPPRQHLRDLVSSLLRAQPHASQCRGGKSHRGKSPDLQRHMPLPARRSRLPRLQ